jgi:parallel beta-helix repeat protein
MGIYIDNYSRDVETRGNTVIDTTISGILYQRSSGQIADNTIYNASTGTEYSAQLDLGGDETRVTVSGNKLFGLNNEAWTLYARSLSNFVASDHNYLFHPYVNKHIAFGPSWTRYSFAGWKSFSGLESNSKTNWYTQAAGETPRSRILYNESLTVKTFDLGTRQYLDLNQNVVVGTVTLAPFTSLILVDNGAVGLQLASLAPSMWGVDAPADFSLNVRGNGFTNGSVVRWNGSNRPTTYINSTSLTASIPAADVSAVAEVPITVYDASGNPTETPPLIFHVTAHVERVYLPMTSR